MGLPFIAGWFIMKKIHENGWFRGNPIVGKLHFFHRPRSWNLLGARMATSRHQPSWGPSCLVIQPAKWQKLKVNTLAMVVAIWKHVPVGWWSSTNGTGLEHGHARKAMIQRHGGGFISATWRGPCVAVVVKMYIIYIYYIHNQVISSIRNVMSKRKDMNTQLAADCWPFRKVTPISTSCSC